MEDWGEGAWARVHLRDRWGAGAFVFELVSPPSDPTTERAPTLVPVFHSFWKWHVAKHMSDVMTHTWLRQTNWMEEDLKLSPSAKAGVARTHFWSENFAYIPSISLCSYFDWVSRGSNNLHCIFWPRASRALRYHPDPRERSLRGTPPLPDLDTMTSQLLSQRLCTILLVSTKNVRPLGMKIGSAYKSCAATTWYIKVVKVKIFIDLRQALVVQTTEASHWQPFFNEPHR